MSEKTGKNVKTDTAETADTAGRTEQQRLSVFKTYKLYVGGKFPRSESGRVYEVTDSKGTWLANAPLSSRKDARDAVVAARKAFGGWSGATAYNRGQVLYRVAEMLEGRREQFAAEVADAEGLSMAEAAAQVDAAVDRWVWYAGWTDKIAQVVGGGNPVAGPFFNLSSPEPTGVVTVLAPRESSFLGLVSVIAPVIATGNTAVVIASEKAPLPALSLGEVLATSDVPGGVVNILSGRTAEIAAPLAAHQDVNAIDLAGADEALAKELEIAAADNLKRVLRPQPVDNWTAMPGTDRMTAFLETKTVWHPTGSLGASGSAY
ncbi:aldehyde dehydrogenase family protein [Streptomyces pratens]|uniref:Aldehyde dehydrogenase family protein n=1 Tax=Streptomyces pratens TaxID=887456 RepID=A0ABW1LVS8_9ACTN